MQRVFISYSHDSEDHKDRVHALADRLRADGVTVIIDRDKMPGGRRRLAKMVRRTSGKR